MAQTHTCRGTATKVTRDLQTTSVTYHRTEVAKVQRLPGYIEVTLKSGGYQTNTTKTRMNQFANEFCNGAFSVFQKKGDWFVNLAGQAVCDFVDGMTFRL